MPKTILDEVASRFNAALAEAARSGADPALVDALTEITQALVNRNRLMTDQDRREMNELYPVDPPAEWPADTMARRRRLNVRIDRRVNRALHSTTTAPRAPRVESRPRARRSPRRGTVKTAQDPGDSDPDADPVGEAIERLLDSAPPFSAGQRDLLGRILGGAR